MGLWSFEHTVTVLPAFAVMIALSMIMRRLLIEKPYEKRMIPIKIISVILIILEIGKQICSLNRGYDLYHLPLHFCSIFLYTLPLMAFYRGKYQKTVHTVTCSAMTSLLLGMLIMPNVIYQNDRILAFFKDYLSFHTVCMHNLVIFALFITLALDLHKPDGKKNEIMELFIFGICFAAVAATASHLLETNFSNFLHPTVEFIKELVDNLKLSAGELPITIIYTAALAILHVLLMIAASYVFLLLCSFKDGLCYITKKNRK